MFEISLLAISILLLLFSLILAVYLFRGTHWRRTTLIIALLLIFFGGFRRALIISFQATYASVAFPILRQDVVVMFFLATQLVTGVILVHIMLRTTERSKAALREREKRFQGIIENTFAGYFYCDRSGCFQNVNRAWLALHGYESEDEVVGKQLSMIQADPDVEMMDQFFTTLLSGTPIPSGELQCRRKDGSVGHHIFSAHPVFEGDSVVGFEGFIIDNTKSKQAEQALRESEEKYHELFEGSYDALMVLNTSTWRFVAGNQSALKMFGVKDIAEFTSYGPWDFSPERQPDGRPSKEKAGEMMGEALKHGAHFFEWNHQRRDGEEFSATVLLTRITTKEEELLQATVRDVTEQKRAEMALRESEARFNQLARLSRTITWEVDASGLCAYISDVVTDVLGYRPDEIVGKKHCYDLAPPMEGVDAREYNLALLARKEPFMNLESQMVAKDGRVVCLSSSGMPVLDADGALLGFRGMDTDITDRKRMEEEKERLQEQFVHTQKIECVGRLAGGMAHDFNNKLGIILGYLEVASQHVDPEAPLRGFLQKIEKAARDSVDLTQRVLTFARRQPVAPQHIDLNNTVEGLFSMLKKVIGEDIHLTWKPNSARPYVMIDPVQVDQVLANLMLNARDAIDGVGTISVETADAVIDEAYCASNREAIPGDYVMLAVSDDGCGMNKETQAIIFEPFFTTKDVGRGTGLGLSTVHGIVKQNNGFINVYSEPDQGALFKIYFPRCATAPDTKTPMPSAPKEALGGNETILVVEDESDLLDLCKLMLDSLGYHTLTACTPAEADQIIDQRQGDIHLLITDVVMPIMNGSDLARRLLSRYPRIKVLFMSGYAENTIVQRGILTDNVHFIQKPFTNEDFAAKIREVLQTN